MHTTTSVQPRVGRHTLQASPAMAMSVAGRQIRAALDATRSRVERDGACGQQTHLAAAERFYQTGKLAEAGEKLFAVNQRLDEREEAAKVVIRVAETLALNTVRGEEQEGIGTGEVRVLSRDGLLWLKTKKRLNGVALLAAERYRGLYACFHSGEVRIARHDGVGGGGAGVVEPAAAKIQAGFDLDDAHRLALHDDGALKWLVEAVCGKGETLMDLAKGDKHAAAKLETELLVACRLLAKHFKIG